jgi:DNA-binding MarR family transcriptional regulator
MLLTAESIESLSDSELRQIMVKHRHKLKDITLTQRELMMLDLLKEENTVNTPRIAKFFDTSTQSASASLRKLKGKGYLNSEEKAEPTGGVIFEFTLNKA